MRLIGKLDSPYVRRVAISLLLMDLPFVHDDLSVFRDFDRIAVLNPIVKAPTLVTDSGVVLMDSTLILELLERLVPPKRRLSPEDPATFIRAQRVIGLALASCEKTVQIVYERQLRPAEKQHQPWLDRVERQLRAAYGLLEQEIGSGETWLFADRPLQADVTAAVAWRFTKDILPELFAIDSHPNLARLAARAEALSAFRDAPPT
ncbi:glutathione S-transferase [Lichenifustis flavocetrariae]|uniref:Glutathione S-transferase family protein n=1 Tax=Lichenifustis flavocetrariae TaxID=2949735 RepID=A0AA41Z3P3_9HYPH|nr:glutathione S-transferase family protein [Lichenifustis flavocetrariae]MCW6509760.1 glutathione S-transferase family protein [Lichenifustis flavocetrariae]